MKSQLSDWIQTKFGGAITVEEANQLIFALYLSVSCLPGDLRRLVWDRANLIGEFVALVREGMVRGVDDSHREPQYWSRTIDQILMDRSRFDYEFNERLHVSTEA
jgi:hypothetical protein